MGGLRGVYGTGREYGADALGFAGGGLGLGGALVLGPCCLEYNGLSRSLAVLLPLLFLLLLLLPLLSLHRCLYSR
jgi:hypothetical protein